MAETRSKVYPELCTVHVSFMSTISPPGRSRPPPTNFFLGFIFHFFSPSNPFGISVSTRIDCLAHYEDVVEGCKYLNFICLSPSWAVVYLSVITVD